MIEERLRAVRSALFLPASNPRAIAKARTLAADLIILDLEDAVADEHKEGARTAARQAAGEGFGEALVAIRLNTSGSAWYFEDCQAVRASGADVVVLPKASSAESIARVAADVGKPVVAMIETPGAIFDARALATAPGLVGLIAGTNDLSAALGIDLARGRAGLATALQMIVLAARTQDLAAFDGVFNGLDDPQGFEAEAVEGRAFGFDGKALIHPSQVDAANRIFGPSAAQIDEANALVEAATGGAERFRGRMIEAMHVEAARRLLARARL